MKPILNSLGFAKQLLAKSPGDTNYGTRALTAYESLSVALYQQGEVASSIGALEIAEALDKEASSEVTHNQLDRLKKVIVLARSHQATTKPEK